MRTPHGMFPEYHTSADDLDFVDRGALGRVARRVRGVLDVLERNRRLQEPRARRASPSSASAASTAPIGGSSIPDRRAALLWVLNLSDGEHDLLAIAERAGLTFAEVADAADALVEAGLLAGIDGHGAAA